MQNMTRKRKRRNVSRSEVTVEEVNWLQNLCDPPLWCQVEEWWRCSQRKSKSGSRIRREKAIVDAYKLVISQKDENTLLWICVLWNVRLQAQLKCFQNVAFTPESLGENTSVPSKGDLCPQWKPRQQSNLVHTVQIQNSEQWCGESGCAGAHRVLLHERSTGGRRGGGHHWASGEGFEVTCHITFHNEQVCKHILDSGLIVVQKMLYLNALSLTSPNNSRLVNDDNLLKP